MGALAKERRITMYLSKEAADEREQILFGEPYSKSNYSLGQIRRFDLLSVDDASRLVKKGYLLPEESQNNSPTVREFIEFARNHPDTEWYFEGYVISPERDDVRVTIDGFGSTGIYSSEDLIAFIMEYRYADELSAELGGGCRCWYD